MNVVCLNCRTVELQTFHQSVACPDQNPYVLLSKAAGDLSHTVENKTNMVIFQMII